jgi:hypothetical protein
MRDHVSEAGNDTTSAESTMTTVSADG